MKAFVRERVATIDDAECIHGLGLEQACVALQSFALKASTLVHVVGNDFNTLRLCERQGRKEVESSKKALSDHAKLMKKNEDLKANLAEQQKAYQEKKEFVKNNWRGSRMSGTKILKMFALNSNPTKRKLLN